jgi:hypothetical protein
MGFFGSLTGSDQRKDLQRANKAANAALDKGYGEQQGYYGQAIDTVDPFLTTGKAGFDAYASSLGLNGDDARRKVQESYFNDPAMMGAEDLAQNKLLRLMNARGVSDSGAQRLASARVLQENYANHLARLAGMGQAGMTAAGQKIGLQTGMGDNSMGFGATKAGVHTNFGNAMAQARGIGINNLIGIAGAAGNLMGGYGKMR